MSKASFLSIVIVLSGCWINEQAKAQTIEPEIRNPKFKFQWNPLPGSAADIAAGTDGTLWYLGCPTVRGCQNKYGWEVYRWNSQSKGWEAMGGNAWRITVDTSGYAWVSNLRLQLFKRLSDRWNHWEDILSYEVNDIGCGADGSIWIIQKGTRRLEGPVYKRVNNQFERFAGGGYGSRIAVDPKGDAWIVNLAGDIYKTDGHQWVHISAPEGGAADIAIGNDGSVWIMGVKPVGDNMYGVYKRDGNVWERYVIPGYKYYYFGALTVGKDNLPIAIIDRQDIFRQGISHPDLGKMLALEITR